MRNARLDFRGRGWGAKILIGGSMRLLCSRFARTFRFVVVATGFSLFLVSNASGSAFNTLHTFCKQSGCPDGAAPQDKPLLDQSGNLYGTTANGGKYDSGVVFELVPNADKSRYKEHVLYNFCAQANCADGANPYADLIMDVDGDIYGTTLAGGAHGHGVIFNLTHSGKRWRISVITSFCAVSNCADGSDPYTGLSYYGQASGKPWDKFSPLFGTTRYGGANGKGAAYQLLTDGSLWNYEVIHSYSGSGPSDSAYAGPLLVDASENLFGVTGHNAKYSGGALYKLTAGSWKETTLHDFCNPATHCVDGATPTGQLAMDAAGDLYGTTWYSDCEQGGCNGGIVFERAANGGFSVLYHFCKSDCFHAGDFPSGLTIDAAGNLLGLRQQAARKISESCTSSVSTAAQSSGLKRCCTISAPTTSIAETAAHHRRRRSWTVTQACTAPRRARTARPPAPCSG